MPRQTQHTHTHTERRERVESVASGGVCLWCRLKSRVACGEKGSQGWDGLERQPGISVNKLEIGKDRICKYYDREAKTA